MKYIECNEILFHHNRMYENVVFFKIQFADKEILLAQMIIICFNQLN